jgi:hypothetical protein
MEGSFASITAVDLAGDVEKFVERIKGWSTSLADVELRHMTVYGPWADQPRIADAWEGASEVDESPHLLEWLKSRVSSARNTPVDHFFYDVQVLSSTFPMVFECEDRDGSLTLSGVPGLAILAKGLTSSVVSAFANALMLVDWKTPAAAPTPEASYQVMAQAIATMGDDGFGVPAFLTSLANPAQGFRGWMVVGGRLLSLHPSDGWLTLNEGVSLIRYFVDCDRMTNDEKMRMRGSGPTAGGRKGGGGGGGAGREGGEGDASGDDDASSGGRRSPLGRADGSAATPSAGYSERSGGGAGHTASSAAPETDESSPEEVLDAEQLAAYQEADLAEFAAKVQSVALNLAI